MTLQSLLTVILIVATFNFMKVSESKVFEQHFCTTGGIVSVQGICKSISECPAVVSNFRAGISPPLCYVEDDQPYVCCPNEKRISEIKCDEYFHLIRDAFSVDGKKAARGCFSKKQVWAFNKAGKTFKPSLQVVGGRDAELNEMSYTAALGYYNKEKGEPDWKCGGTLISEQFVLTAAHCLTGKQPTHVLLGVKNLYDQQEASRIEAIVDRVYIHPEYKSPTKYNDLGLIKLDRKLTFNQYLHPACLPQPSRSLESVNKTITAGWGRLEYFGQRAETLQIANLNKYNMRECTAAYGEGSQALKLSLPRGFIKSQICAGDKSGASDTCDGDSGGPLVVRDGSNDCIHFVVGITSFGTQFCGSGVPAIYTNVQSYLDWIEDIVWGTATNS